MTRYGPRQFSTDIHLAVSAGMESLDLIAEVKFTYCPGREATPPSYASGGDPPEPPSFDDVEVVKLAIDGTEAERSQSLECPKWLGEWLAANADKDELFEAVDYGPDPDEMRDRMQDREMQRDRGELDDGSDE